MTEKDIQAAHFLDLIKKSRRGKFKIYIGMSAGVGKTYRMLQEAHALQKNGIDIKIGYIETHFREETHILLDGLTLIPRRTLFYKGKSLEELDVQAIINLNPEVVVIDELAHTNIEGSKNVKRWQDVVQVLEAGISVISAVNIQHIESLNEEVKVITGIEVTERIPDKVLLLADEVVNIDLTADELIARLKQGKIYKEDKIQAALQNFFKNDHILQLRELALKEVASLVERKVDLEVPKNKSFRHEKMMACIDSNEKSAKNVIRKTARLASYYHAAWLVIYVQTPSESVEKIALDKQRYLIQSFKLATELGAEVIQIQSRHVVPALLEQALARQITTVCIGKPAWNWLSLLGSSFKFHSLLKKLSSADIDLIILS